MKSLIRWSVARPVAVTVLTLAVMVFGAVALRELAVDLLPSVEVPRVSITTQYEGVAPQEVETLLTRPIEQALSTIEGVEKIEAVSSEGLSRVQLQFVWGTELQEALDDIRAALDRVRPNLPEDADPPSVYKFDLSTVPVAFLGVSGDGDPRRLKFLAEDELSRSIERLPGVASVDVSGGQDREIQVVLDANRLIALGVSSEQVIQALAKENRTVSAGEMEDRGREVVIRTTGEFERLEDMLDVVVTTREGTALRIRDLGGVVDSIRRIRSRLWIDGVEGIRLRIFKQSGANTVEVADTLKSELEHLNQRYAGRAQLSFIWDSSEFIRASVTNVQSSAGYGALLAVVVLLLFLRDLRATLVVATAIPVSIIATFAVMHFQGMTLNVISFGGLALGVGMLVDGAIVILESIYRKREDGLGTLAAAVAGASEVGSAVVAGTLTTLAVFVPVVFVGGFAGIFFGELALVVTFALACSLVVALTVVPMLSGRWLKPNPAPERGFVEWLGKRFAALDRAYGRMIGAALEAPMAVIIAALALLIGSFSLVPRIGTELMPESDEGRLEISVELPVGTPLETTQALVRDLERGIRESLHPGELEHMITTAGPDNWWRPGGGNEGKLDITLVPSSERARGIDEVMSGVQAVVRGAPGAKIQVRKSTANLLTRIARGGDDRLVVEIRGHDLDTADSLAQQVIELATSTPGVTFARADRELGQLEREVVVDRQRASELGVGSAEVARAIESYVLGSVASRYRDRGDEFDIRVLLQPDQRERLSALGQLPIVTPDGRSVPLSSIARVQERLGPSSISRVNQERVIRIGVGTGERPLSDVTRELQAKLDALHQPDGFNVAFSGELSEQRETFVSLVIGIVLSILLVFATMAVQFESVRSPLVVMVSIPFALVGAIISLVLTGTTLNMNSLLGVIVLVGIVVNNAIVLVDYTNQLTREHGLSLRAALIEAGTRRLRPILMTTLTTALALLPVAIAVAEGSEIQAPLARVVIGGLMTSTLVTLVLVPCVSFVTAPRREREGATADRGLDARQLHAAE